MTMRGERWGVATSTLVAGLPTVGWNGNRLIGKLFAINQHLRNSKTAIEQQEKIKLIYY